MICTVVLLLASPVWLFYLAEPLSRWKYAQANQRARAERLYPAATWVHTFVAEHNRLPDRAEVQAFSVKQLLGGNVALYRKSVLGLPNGGSSDKDFVLATSTSEWNLYYCSWNREVLELYSE